MSRWWLLVGDYPPLYVGGVAAWMSALARGLAERGEEVRVLARGARSLRGRLWEARWDAAAPYPVRRLRGRRWNRRQARLLARALEPRLQPGDRVLAAHWPAALELAGVCRRRGARLLVGAHGSEVAGPLSRPPGLEALEGVPFAAVSGFLADRLRAWGLRARAVPSPVDAREPRPGRGRYLLVVARLTPLKGVERALALAAVLGWPLLVVGEGPEAPRLRRLARRLGAPARFLGRREPAELPALYRGARALLLLSREEGGRGGEGLGLVVLEAAAHGVPAAVSPVGGLPEAAGGELVLPRPDDAAASAEALRAFLEDPGAGRRAWERLRARHGTARCIEALERLFEEAG